MEQDSSIGSGRKDHEFQFSDNDFEQIRKLIYDHAGISLGQSKREMAYSRLARRLRVNGLTSFKDYLDFLESGDATEWEAFTNSLTTNLTAFFREPHHFPMLTEHVQKQQGKHPILLWCSASSTGEEPYSMAMAMAMVDLFGSFTPPVKILATDLDTNVLATAQAGVYSLERIEKLPADIIKRFFLKGSGHQAGQTKVRQELRDMISFRQLNLLDASWPIGGPFDAIFCRNVMIYFDRTTQYNILEKFTPLMRPDGLLFAGHSESFQQATNLFKLRGKTVYELSNKIQPKHR